tara:strand:+ start:195 stop:473 length:279 start_codon:yes stop_codon:yes gene_type:complete
MDMLAELAIANAAFQVIKQTLSNGKEIADAGSALTKYFSASQSIQQKAKMGTGDVLAAYQAKQAIEKARERIGMDAKQTRHYGLLQVLPIQR